MSKCVNCLTADTTCRLSERQKRVRNNVANVSSSSQASVHQNTANGMTLKLPKGLSSVSASPEGNDSEEEVEQSSLYMGPGSGLKRGFMSSHRVN